MSFYESVLREGVKKLLGVIAKLKKKLNINLTTHQENLEKVKLVKFETIQKRKEKYYFLWLQFCNTS